MRCTGATAQIYSTDFTFTAMRHAFNFLKKEIITFKPMPASNLTLFN
jgi:hypothetical protein